LYILAYALLAPCFSLYQYIFLLASTSGMIGQRLIAFKSRETAAILSILILMLDCVTTLDLIDKVNPRDDLWHKPT